MIVKAEGKLTIGIPTKNRAHMLVVLLEDIKKYQADLPIVISDNSDCDDTASLVEKYSQWLNINYVRIAKNVNQAKNTNSVLKNTQTKYVVLMHDDDRFIPVSIPSYLALIDYIEACQLDMFGVYVKEIDFRNERDLDELLKPVSSTLEPSDVRDNFQIFHQREYQSYFVQQGIGGRASGMLIDCHLVKSNNICFPTNAGAKIDKLFFLSANAIGAVGYWKKPIIAKYLHQDNSLYRRVTENHYLFNQKIIEIYEEDNLAIAKIHQRRIKKWINDVPQFKPIALGRLLGSSRLELNERISIWLKYILLHSKRFRQRLRFLAHKNK